MRLHYPAQIIRLAQACSAVDDVRFYLNGILLATNGEVVGTDGHRLFRSTSDNTLEDYKIVQLESDILKTADHAVLDFDTMQCEQSRVLVSGKTKQLPSIPFELLEGRYINYDRVIPDTDRRVATDQIGFNAYYLAQIALFADYSTYGGVKLSLFGPDNSMLIEPAGWDWPDKTCMVIMPMRL